MSSWRQQNHQEQIQNAEAQLVELGTEKDEILQEFDLVNQALRGEVNLGANELDQMTQKLPDLQLRLREVEHKISKLKKEIKQNKKMLGEG